jgi:predicted DNA-binding helix-hairpin-helix protein
VDPKLAWALAHHDRFPVDVNRAPKELLLRVPGLGVKAVNRLLAARRVRRVRADDLQRLHVPVKKVLPFVLMDGHTPRAIDAANFRTQMQRAPQQASLF